MLKTIPVARPKRYRLKKKIIRQSIPIDDGSPVIRKLLSFITQSRGLVEALEPDPELESDPEPDPKVEAG